MMKDKMILSEEYDELKLKCYSCNSNSHNTDFCPVISYIPNFELAIQKIQFS